MGVAPGEPDIAQLFRLDPALDIGGEPALFVAPQAVLFDERSAACSCPVP
jgi:hypothetical protein